MLITKFSLFNQPIVHILYIQMAELSFVWDPAKDRANQSKHDGVGFEEARTVFYDEHARVMYDPVTKTKCVKNMISNTRRRTHTPGV